MFGTGRRPNTSNLGLEKAGVDVDERSGAIKVDAFSRTTAPGVWAIGDVTDRMALTPVALMEAMAFCESAFGEWKEFWRWLLRALRGLQRLRPLKRYNRTSLSLSSPPLLLPSSYKKQAPEGG